MSGETYKIIISAKNKTKQAFTPVMADIDKIAKKVLSAKSAVLGLAGVAGLGALIKVSADAAHQASVYSKAVGTSVEEMTAWQYAAKTVNLEADKMGDIFKDVTEKIADAFANGGGEAKEVLERLNLDLEHMANLSPDQQLLQVANALGEVGTQSEKVQIMESLASDASLLLPLLENNAEGLKQLRDEAIASGNAIGNIDAAQMEAANQSMIRAKGIVTGIATQLTVKLAPYLEYTANWFLENAKQAGGVGEMVNSAMDSATTAIGYVITALDYMQIGWEVIKLGVGTFATVSLKALNSIINPIRYVNELLGVEQPAAFKFLTHLVGDFEQAAIDGQANLLNMISSVGQNAEAAKGALKDVKQAAEEVAAIQVQQNADDNSAAVEAAAARIAEVKAAEQEQLDLAHALAIVSEQEYQQELVAAADLATAQKISIVGSMMGNLSSLMSTQSKKLFNIGKVAAIAGGFIKMYESILSSYAAGAKIGGPPLGAAFATTAGVAAGAHLANIKKQKFSGQAHAGLDNVPSEGTYLLQKGEMVLDPGTSEKVRNNAIGGDKNVNVTFAIPSDEYGRDMLKNNRGLIFNLMTEAMNEEGFSWS